MKTNLLKKIMSLALSAAMIFSMTASSFAAGLENSAPTQTPAQTTSPAETSDKTVTATVTQTGAANNDELFDQYVEGMFYGGGVQTYSSTAGRDSLNATGVEIYEAIKSKILTIADGTASSTVFSDIPLNIKPEDFDGAFGKAIDALLQDCPSELYWYDKTVGTASALSYSETKTDCFLTIKMAVANSYRKDGNQYATDSTKIAAAKKAFDNARSIASSATGSDADKLKTFKDKICEMVSYDTKAASGGAYGDSFQLTNVFDGDKNTNVVCEGYAKAFQYLCELSGIECYTVTGKMAGGTGAGPHMWNIVRLDGKSYVVDVTNCDTGTIGAPDKLFLKGVTISGSSYKVAGVTYTYDSETTSLLSSSVLTPSTTDYGASVDVGWTLVDGVLTIENDDGMNDWFENGRAANANNVKTVKIESGVNYIVKRAFEYCENMTSVEIPSTVKSIGSQAFRNCNILANINIPEGVETIGNYAFYSCTSLTSINISDTVKTIGESAFYSCTNLTSITIPAGVKAIENGTFKSCIKLESVTIPEGVETIGDLAFNDCRSLTSVTIPSTVRSIGAEAFSHCTGLASITIPEGVETIGGSAFLNCSSLTSINLPDTLKFIDRAAFNSCSGLTSVTLSAGLTAINAEAFSGCASLKSIIIPDTVNTIGVGAFYNSGITSVTMLGTVPPRIENSVFEKSGLQNESITVPEGYAQTYKDAWGTAYADLIKPDHIHTFSEAWSSNNDYHWHASNCGHYNEVKDKAPHTWDEGEITEQATETSPGTMTYTCNTCKATKEETISPIEHTHNLTHVQATDPTCTADGNIEYYTCTCGTWFEDAAGTKEITDKDSVILPAAHNLEEVPAKEPTCDEAGNIAYNICTACGKLFSADGKTEITEADTVLTAAHKLTKIEAKPATCTADGSKEYYICSVCDKWFSDYNGTTEITDKSSVVIPAAHKLTKVEAKPATCTKEGNIEHYKCTDCGNLFRDANGTEETDANSVIIPMAAHKLEVFAAKEPTCELDGNIAYQTCSVCKKFFSEDGKTEITEADTVLPIAHKLTKVEAKPATCTADGSKEYYTCSVCNKWFSDYNGTTEITDKSSVVIPAAHKLTKVEAKPATCTKEGNIEHYKCTDCGNLFRDANGTEEIDANSVIIPMAAHKLEVFAAKEPTCELAGNIAYQTCSVCKKFFSEDGKTEITEADTVIPAAHNLEAIAAKEPTCTEAGNIAYQFCSACGKYFTADGKTEITQDKTVLPAKGHTFSTEWSHDDNDHWHPAACEHTGEVSEIASHTWNTGVITTEPTETTTGVKTYTCTVCLRTRTEILPVTTHVHNPEEGWKSDNDNHWHSCSGCEEKLDHTAHSFNAWEITNPATEQATGTRQRSCTVCGFIVIETIPQLEHTHDLEHIAAVKSTCNKEGSVEHYHCKKCGKNYSDSTATNELASITIPTDSNNHTGGTELRGDKKATCRVNGYTGDTYCLGCNTLLSYGTTIYASPSGHKYVGGRCRYCGILQFPFMYRPVITYLNDSFHFFNGMSRMHSPNSHGLYSDGVYEWYVCAECGHEYGRTKVTIPEVNIDDDDSVDLIVDDPVQCGSDELLYIAG